MRYAGQPPDLVHVDQLGAVAAVDRIAAGLQADLRMVNAPIYRSPTTTSQPRASPAASRSPGFSTTP